MSNIEERFLKIRVNINSEHPSLHKPLLLLLALGRFERGEPRMLAFYDIDRELSRLLLKFFSEGSSNLNTHYPFGRLENDGIWEIEYSSTLKRTSVGHLFKSELLARNIHGGFTIDIFSALMKERWLVFSIARRLAEQYFSVEQRFELLEAVGMNKHYGLHPSVGFGEIDANSSSQLKEFKTDGVMMDQVGAKENGFISYLNSLHSLEASGSNSLAESQALSPYFGELYVSFPLINKLTEILTDGVPRVVILTGHAGDGKSTVALDILKRLRGIPPKTPLGQPMRDREDTNTASGTVSIVKDMSELGAQCRRQWLDQAFQGTGSWLIVSNTGPLLSSLTNCADEKGMNPGIESAILDLLDRPLDEVHLETHTLDGFGKELVILNLTRWNNLKLVDEILPRLVNHSGWGPCATCNVETACPLMLNRKALRDAGSVPGERVRWIYQRLSAYEQRLTLRQIVAQLAFGLTGGMSCDEARQRVTASTVDGSDRGTIGLEQIVFSEGFFGYRAGKPWHQAQGLHAVALLRRATFGAPVGVDYESRLSTESGIGWASLPPPLNCLGKHWQQRASEAAAVNWRFALRRMVYLFGTVLPGKEEAATVFLDSFVQSPSLRELDRWQMAGKLTLSLMQASRLRTSCLRILLEVFSGFNPRQFQSTHDALYLTLRRPDRAVVQPTQLVIETLRFQDFDLRFDQLRRRLILSYQKGKPELELTLPLLDYIRRRDAGELGNALSPIHQGQLDWFRAELLRVTADRRQGEDEFALLRAGIDGAVHPHRFLLDLDKEILEPC